MRHARAIAVTALAAIVFTTPVGASATSSPASPMSAVPKGAGRLVLGPIKYMWPARHVTGANTQSGAVDQSADLHYAGGAAVPGSAAIAPELYIVFWGSQWSRNDPAATYLTSFFTGLYGPGDDWTSVASQYCEGVPAGTITCPAGAAHVGPPNGPLVKGVWFDDTQLAVPFTPVANVPELDQMAQEAVRAAAHFGNTAPASNTEAIYLIALPSKFLATGEGFYCGYHRSISSGYGDIAYINLPYVSDLGAGCFADAVNANGPYDGFSIIGGHEYLEAVTDMRPLDGWVDAQNSESADKCEGITSGQGAMADLTLSTGIFAVQSTWSNAFDNGAGGCVLHSL